MVDYDKGYGKRLLVGYNADRARKDAYNREKGLRRLEKAYRRGTLTKMTLPQSKQAISRTHQRIAPFFSDDFWGTR